MKHISTGIIDLLDDLYEYFLKTPSVSHLTRGEYGKGNSFPDRSFSALLANKSARNAWIKKISHLLINPNLTNIDRLALNTAAYFVDYELFPVPPLMEEYYYLSFDITPYNLPFLSFWNSLALLDISTQENVQKHLKLTEGYVEFCQQMKEKVFDQASLGIYLFADAIPGTSQNLRTYGSIAHDQHPLSMKRASSAATREQLVLEKGLLEKANRHLREIADFLESVEYTTKAPKKPGWGQYERGLDYYRFLRKFHLGYDLEAGGLHALGLAKMKQAVNAQSTIRERLGCRSSHEVFLRQMKENERFYPNSAESLENVMNDFKDRVSSRMEKYFFERIQTPCKVKRLDPAFENSLTFGQYVESYDVNQPGIYYFNGQGLPGKCQINAPALVAHELLPGHHFQQSLVNESEDIHTLFKGIYTTSYAEGWAEYAVSLAGETSMFDDFELYGQLENDKLLCARLIVDTGLNELGWSMDQARRFLVENTLATPEMAEMETVRYAASIPAQCLPYKYSGLKMLSLRERYKTATGKKFDLRRYHSLVLSVGNVPMPLLESFLEEEIVKEMVYA